MMSMIMYTIYTHTHMRVNSEEKTNCGLLKVTQKHELGAGKFINPIKFCLNVYYFVVITITFSQFLRHVWCVCVRVTLFLFQLLWNFQQIVSSRFNLFLRQKQKIELDTLLFSNIEQIKWRVCCVLSLSSRNVIHVWNTYTHNHNNTSLNVTKSCTKCI